MRILHVTRYVARLGLILTLLVSTQGMLLVNVAFKANARFIAERLCVNRARPELKCHGKCYLDRMRKAQAEREARQVAHVEMVVGTFAATAPLTFRAPENAATRASGARMPRPTNWRAGPDGRQTGVFQPPRSV